MSLSFLIIVTIPAIVGATYLLAIASNRYASEFRVIVRSIDAPKLGGMSELFGLAGPTKTTNDSYAVVQYLQSRDAFEKLSAMIPVRNLFAAPTIDLFSRVKSNAPVEAFERYWNERVTTYYEPTTGLITTRVTAFTPNDAYAISQALYHQAEDFVNDLSAKARKDSVAFAERELQLAEKRLADYRQQLQALQDREHMLDPQKSADVTLTLAGKLREEIARLNATLSTQRTQLGPDAPSIRATASYISGLQKELARVEGQVTADSPPGSQPAAGKQNSASQPLSSKLGEFQQLADEKAFAEKAYLSALLSLETARADADRNQIYLATVVSPGKPEEPVFPRFWRDWGSLVGILMTVWVVTVMGVYSVREHI